MQIPDDERAQSAEREHRAPSDVGDDECSEECGDWQARHYDDVHAASQLPRAPGGTNSVIVEYPTTFSAPSPTPMMKRNRVRTVIEGEKAEAMAASPKIARLA